MGREFELKFSATEAIQQAILAQYPGGHTIAMETTYFDTADGALSRRHMTLRLRRENEETVCTLKTPLPDGSRGEWECPATDLTAGIEALLVLGAPVELKALTQQGLMVVCGARFTRQAIDLPTADGLAELALDHGVLLGGGKEIPLREAELELKSGSEEALLTLSRTIATTYGLQPEPESKFRRASVLAQGE